MAAGCGSEMLFQDGSAVFNRRDEPFGHAPSPNLRDKIVDDLLPDRLWYTLGNAAIDEDFNVMLGQ